MYQLSSDVGCTVGMYRQLDQKQTETMLEQDALLHPHTPEKKHRQIY